MSRHLHVLNAEGSREHRIDTSGDETTPLLASDLVQSMRGPVGAYIHVPFCEQICPFCPYNKVLHDEERVRSYVDALEREVTRVTARMPKRFTSLYIGGGTPTLCVKNLERVLPLLDVENETAIECLPTHATEARLRELTGLGVTALSLGVQSFSDDVLQHLKRPTTAADNIAALEVARKHIDLLDVDLMFDVAYEDEATFLSDLSRCFDADVDQVSTYPVMRFGYTPFGKSDHLAKREHEALARASEMAEERGYERRSVWTFNRKDAPNYTSITRPFYLGFGAGAASYTGDLFTVNAFNLEQYRAMLSGDDERLPASRAFSMSPLVSAAYAVFWQMYTGRLDTAWVRTHFGRRAFALFRNFSKMMARLDLLDTLDDDVFTLTPAGYDRYHDLERWVTYHFIEPLWKEMMAQHDVDGGAASLGAGWLRLSGRDGIDPVWEVAKRFLHDGTAPPRASEKR